MSRKIPSLNAIRAFEAAARLMSFSRAGQELRVTQGAISRQIKTLEIYLGVPLFIRLTRAIELTEHGRLYLAATRDALDRIEETTLRIISQPGAGVLTVNVLPTLAMRWLIPRLPGFTGAHPGIEVRMITSISPVHFEREDLDLAIRVGTPPNARIRRGGPRIDLRMAEDWTGVRADRLMPDVLVPVCSPALRDGATPLRRPADLARHVLLHTASRPHGWPDWLRAVGLTGVDAEAGPAFGHFFMSLQAAMEGKGVALIPRILVESDLASGNLIVPFEVPVESAGAYFLLCRERQANLPRIKAFREWLLSERSRAPSSA
jgi:LysR family glycine cleavage system transcriptional activator